MKFLFLFLDGVGLGAGDPQINPFSTAEMPYLQSLAGGSRLLAGSAPLETARLTLLALDANLGVSGLPQSATGQATLLTGANIPMALGYHYGPKPNPAVAGFLQDNTLFHKLMRSGRSAALLNAYPPRYFEAIASGRRIYSAIPLAATRAGLTLKTSADLFSGRALSADFTGQGWRNHLGISDSPVFSPTQAGRRLAELAVQYDFAFFEYWLSDYAGHRQDMQEATALLEGLDQVIAGLLDSWDDRAGLVLITSDHGNLEDLGTRRHTLNPVPALVAGAPELRQRFTAGLKDIAGIAPAILQFY
ncbi:MAG: hypothetical protein EHM70_17920 [Chloroflexota bacterium]|nr:MAG: hypothetical protein EHM70_17920 [Chloroflexota bacterium]